MKIKHIALYTLIALFTTSAWAQKKDKKMSYERLRAMKINFVIEKVDLTTEEESFVWGAFEAYETRVYNKYHKKMKSLRKKRLANIEEVSEAGANETLDSIIHFRALINSTQFRLQSDNKKLFREAICKRGFC